MRLPQILGGFGSKSLNSEFTRFFIEDDMRLFEEILLRDCQVVQFSNGGHLIALAIKEYDLAEENTFKIQSFYFLKYFFTINC